MRITRFILTKLRNGKYPLKYVRVDEYGALENLVDVTNLIVDEFNTSRENTGSNASWINGNNEGHNRSINNMVISGLIDSNQHGNKWYCASETPEEVYR